MHAGDPSRGPEIKEAPSPTNYDTPTQERARTLMAGPSAAPAFFHGGGSSLLPPEELPKPKPKPSQQVKEEEDAAVEMIQVEQMLRVAAQCGQHQDAVCAWSPEEHNQLLHALDRYAKEQVGATDMCFLIARHLPNKIAHDVALRYRWLQGKKKTANKEAELVDKHPAGEKVNKRKKTKGAKSNKKIYPLSKEALDSKLTEELIWDNHMFLERIEDNLKSGQLDNSADYFYFVKTNLDAIEKRLSGSGISMAVPPIDEEGLEEILQSRLNSLPSRKAHDQWTAQTHIAAAVGEKRKAV